ncbi:T9SS-dependent choice-of-anchor J family protein [Chryseobacterium sp.]|uniref:T9SS-dependent choice-of-anchor J family protein n=1 Tax=Chryseobacterium sp. TaxID=1871047 RepID=UPI00289AD636|nr:choice-of-anchor J domain-containing protein [Chryseobacterium sp.]
MKKIITVGVFLGLCSINAQTTIFEDSFETYPNFAYTTGNVGNWTLTDIDEKNSYIVQGANFPNEGIPKAYIVFNGAPATSNSVKARTGDKAMACFNVSAPPPLVNNDWLISPQITLGSSGNNVSFWARPSNSNYGLEKFNIWVSTTNTDTTSFTKLNTSTIVTPSIVEWNQYTFNLDSYAGQNIYIAIQCVSDDQFALFIDDFKVTTTGALATSEAANKDSSISVYPNPVCDVLTIKSKERINNIEIFDISGRNININSNNDKIDVQSLNPGSYIINIETKKGKITRKFIKK